MFSNPYVNYIILTLCVVLLAFFKAIRDIITWRWNMSIFSDLPKSWQDFLIDPKNIRASHDGWHLFDMLLVVGFFYLEASWLGIFLYMALFYTVFDWFFHSLFMKPEHKENFIKLEYNVVKNSLKRWFK